ncbi:MAG: hypothetical protein NTV80_10280 [Verrucomicrobia bacterium]|nr:hypothetical protein [Verrucomicrobiota bacterium]
MKRLQCLIALTCILAVPVTNAGDKPAGKKPSGTTRDYTKGEPSTCEVHRLEMFKRAVPFGHGVISKNPNDEQWKRRKDHYPHPGDCYPATSIILPGETGRVLVYVCKKCEAAKKEMEAKEP